MVKNSKIASHSNSGRLAGPFFLHFWASWVKLRLHEKFQLPRLAKTTQLYFSGWLAGRPAKPEINANLSPALSAGAWAELGKNYVRATKRILYDMGNFLDANRPSYYGLSLFYF